MAVITGTGGAINGVPEVRDWTVTETIDLPQFRSSATAKGTGRRNGGKDWTGSWNSYGGIPTHFPGDSITFTGQVATSATKGVTGTALIQDCTMNWDMEAKAILSYSCNFGGHGAMTKGTVSASDASTPNPLVTDDLPIHWNGSALSDVRQATLTLSRVLTPYRTNSTGLWMYRKAGSADCSATITIYGDDPDGLPDVGDVAVAKFYVTNSTFFQIGSMRIQSVAVNVPIEEDGLVAYTLSLSWDGWPSGGQGAIVKPDTNNWWPFA